MPNGHLSRLTSGPGLCSMWFAGFSILAAIPALNRLELHERGTSISRGIKDRLSMPAIDAPALPDPAVRR